MIVFSLQLFNNLLLKKCIFGIILLKGSEEMYFDPGTGSLIIQMILGLIAGFGAFFIAFKTKFLNLFRRKKNKKNEKKNK